MDIRLAIRSIVSISLILASATIAGAESFPVYVGNVIPGVKIVKSRGFHQVRTSTVSENDIVERTIMSSFGKACSDMGGIAVVNFRVVFNLGNLSENDGGRIITKLNGIKYVMLGDCVIQTVPE